MKGSDQKPPQIYCDQCEEFVDASVEPRALLVQVRDRKYEIDGAAALCPHCGSELYLEDLEDRIDNEAFDLYRQDEGILKPDEIKELLTAYGLTQTEMSELLGWGKITVHRYVHGALPDKAHNDMLKLLRSPLIMLYYLTVCKVSDDLKERVEGRIKETMAEYLPDEESESTRNSPLNQGVSATTSEELYSGLLSEAKRGDSTR